MDNQPIADYKVYFTILFHSHIHKCAEILWKCSSQGTFVQQRAVPLGRPLCTPVHTQVAERLRNDRSWVHLFGNVHVERNLRRHSWPLLGSHHSYTSAFECCVGLHFPGNCKDSDCGQRGIKTVPNGSCSCGTRLHGLHTIEEGLVHRLIHCQGQWPVHTQLRWPYPFLSFIALCNKIEVACWKFWVLFFHITFWVWGLTVCLNPM